MAVITNSTLSTDITVTARQIDFVSSFERDMQALRDIMGISRPIKMEPGSVLRTITANVSLNNTQVGEGDEVGLSKATVTEAPVASITLEKYQTLVTAEAILKWGYDIAVDRVDRAFRRELEDNIMSRFYTFLGTGTLTPAQSTTFAGFQDALAQTKGLVDNFFKSNKLGIDGVVAFVNIEDFYKYLGGANLVVQNQFGMYYIENFLGYRTVFLCSSNEVPSGKIFATAENNIMFYYVDASNSDLARAGLNYTVGGGETNLIGFWTEGDYNRVSSREHALMGITILAEYLNGIANVSF